MDEQERREREMKERLLIEEGGAKGGVTCDCAGHSPNPGVSLME